MNWFPGERQPLLVAPNRGRTGFDLLPGREPPGRVVGRLERTHAFGTDGLRDRIADDRTMSADERNRLDTGVKRDDGHRGSPSTHSARLERDREKITPGAKR